MNNEKLQSILDELYQLDPELKKHEPKLMGIVKKFIENKPDVKIDRLFVEELRNELALKADQMSSEKTKTSFAFWRNLSYAGAGIVLAALIMIPVFQNMFEGGPVGPDGSLFSPQKITRLDSRAWGSLAGEGAGNMAPDGAAATMEKMASSYSAPGGSAEEASVPVEPQAIGLGGGGGAPVGSTARMIMPEPVNYKYVYNGDMPDLDNMMNVYRKVTSEVSASKIGQYIQGLNTGLFDMGKFNNLKVDNLNITEDRDFGYMLYFNLRENLVSINANWERWPDPARDCRDSRCFESLQLKPEDVPGDEAIIAMADKFLKDYNIDMSNYGPGIVRDEWRLYYARAEKSGEKPYVPDIMNVVYPLVVDGKTVYDQSGHETGLNVQVNVRNNRVYGLNTLSPQTYEASEYEMETDKTRLRKLVEQGSIWQPYYPPDAAKTLEIELGEPSIRLVNHWKYDQAARAGQELLVPALVFPVLSDPEENRYYPEAVTIILVKDILDEAQASNPGIIEPMPLIRSEEAPAIEPMIDDDIATEEDG